MIDESIRDYGKEYEPRKLNWLERMLITLAIIAVTAIFLPYMVSK